MIDDIRVRKFCDAYLSTFNATTAAVAAGYSAATAGQTGYKLLRKPEIQAYLAERRAAITTATDVSLADVVNELKKIAFADMRDVCEWGTKTVDLGNYVQIEAAYFDPKDSTTLSPAASAAVAEVSQGKAGLKIKLHSKTTALDMLMKHFGGYERDNQQKGDALARLIESAQGSPLPIASRQPKPEAEE